MLTIYTLGNIQPDHWLAEYTTELINVLNVLGLLVEIEPKQAELLERICSGPTLSAMMLSQAGAFDIPTKTGPGKKKSEPHNPLFDRSDTDS